MATQFKGNDRSLSTMLLWTAYLYVMSIPSVSGSSPPEILTAGNRSITLRATASPLSGEGMAATVAPFKSFAHARFLTAEEAAENPPQGPYFLVPPATHVTTRAGQTAALTCIVKQLAERQVSWIRGRDLHVLSSGLVAFSSDSRVSVANIGDSWTLTVRYTQPRDSGSYACQVNTQPRMVTWFNLTVVEARATILGKETLYVQSGSTVVLECVVREELLIPGLVLWYQDDRLVDRGSSRITVDTSVGNVTSSRLIVVSAEASDSGNYSCWPSAGKPDNVVVHVIQGDPPAAMHHGNSAPGFASVLLITISSISLLFFLT